MATTMPERITWTLKPSPIPAPAPVIRTAWRLRLGTGAVIVTVYQQRADNPGTWVQGESFNVNGVVGARATAEQRGVAWSSVSWDEPSGRVERTEYARDFVRRAAWDRNYLKAGHVRRAVEASP